jgi:hypothetical protein
VRKLLAWITSIRLAIGLLVYLIVSSSIATLVPQGLPPDHYRAMYARVVADLVIFSGFNRFFGSVLFIIPAFVFFANLSACTVKRLLRELKRKSVRHHGPDVLHLGLMLLVIASILSFAGHRRASLRLAPGNGVNLPDGGSLMLDDFRFLRYDDGRPKDWVSLVTITKDGVTVKDGYELRVNSPLRYGGLTFYQTSYVETQSLLLSDSSGITLPLAQGVVRIIGDTSYLFMAPDVDGRSAIVRLGGGAEAAVIKVAPGDMAGAMNVLGLKTNLVSVLEAVSDPAYPLVFASLVLIALGTSWTFFQKLKEGV